MIVEKIVDENVRAHVNWIGDVGEAVNHVRQARVPFKAILECDVENVKHAQNCVYARHKQNHEQYLELDLVGRHHLGRLILR